MTESFATTNAESKVVQQLTGKRILITGTTGFLGKVVLEKILRTTPDIGAIYLLIRGNSKYPKAEDRFHHEIACSSIFDHLKLQDTEKFDQLCDEKIHCVTGEVTEPMFGMTRSQFEDLAESVDLIVNSAASVDFREPLNQALSINALSLHQLIELSAVGGEIPMLQVSTCYVSGFNSGHMLEKNVRPAGIDLPEHPDGYFEVDQLIAKLQDKIARTQSKYTGEELKKALVDLGISEANNAGWNDTYTFTKWIGEQLLRKGLRGQRLTIVRPSIIESTLSDPVPGWVEGVKVADALIMAYARGKTAFFPGKADSVLDVIPVDLVANSIILSAAELFAADCRHRVYQCCSGASNPVKLGEFRDYVAAEAMENHARHDKLFYKAPKGTFQIVSKTTFTLAMKAVRLPLLLADKGRQLLGQEERLKLLDNIDTTITLATIYSFYTAANYVFHSEKLERLCEEMPQADQAMFPVSARDIDWEEYVREIHIAGLNRYALKERKLYTLKSRKQKRKTKAA